MLAPRRNESPMQYWISLWPTAPMFGVRWRFEGMNPAMAFFNPAKVAGDVARASAEETAKVVEEAAAAAETQAAAVGEAVESAATTVAESAAEAVEDSAAMVDETAAVVAESAEASVEDVASALTPPTGLYPAPPALIDDLKLIRGVGPKLEQALNDLGVFRFEQLAAFTDADLAWLDAQLASFRMRPQGVDLVAQAKALG